MDEKITTSTETTYYLNGFTSGMALSKSSVKADLSKTVPKHDVEYVKNKYGMTHNEISKACGNVVATAVICKYDPETDLCVCGRLLPMLADDFNVDVSVTKEKVRKYILFIIPYTTTKYRTNIIVTGAETAKVEYSPGTAGLGNMQFRVIHVCFGHFPGIGENRYLRRLVDVDCPNALGSLGLHDDMHTENSKKKNPENAAFSRLSSWWD